MMLIGLSQEKLVETLFLLIKVISNQWEIIRFIGKIVEVVILTNKTLLFMQIWHHLVEKKFV